MKCECAARDGVHDHKLRECSREAVMMSRFMATIFTDQHFDRNLCMECFTEMKQAGLNIVCLEIYK